MLTLPTRLEDPDMAVKIPFTYRFDFEYGKMQQLSPRIRRVIANNPGAFSFTGTGTFIIGRGKVAMIDPGPLMEEHIEAILDGIKGEEVTHILITHTHMDHSPAARIIKERTGAKTYGYGPHGEGKREQGVKVEEGGDMDFIPDVKVTHGEIIKGHGWNLEAVYTPGHTSNHMCYQLQEEKALFTGDHVMGWSTSIISPPDGDMTDYMNSLDLLLQRNDEIYWPNHGTCITDPKSYVRSFITHRQEREDQILNCLSNGLYKIQDMVPTMYTDLDINMYQAAARSVFAAIIRLIEMDRVTCKGELKLDSRYALP